MNFNEILAMNVGEKRVPKFVPVGEYLALCVGADSKEVGATKGLVEITFKAQSALGGQDVEGIDITKPKMVAALWSSKSGNDDETFNRLSGFARSACPNAHGPLKDVFESMVGNLYIVTMKHWQQPGRDFPTLQVDKIRPA